MAADGKIIIETSLDTEGFKKGTGELGKAVKSAGDKIKTAFGNSAKVEIDALKRSVDTLKSPIDAIKKKFQEAASAAETQKNRLAVLAAAHESAKKKVADLTAEFNKSAKENGIASEKTQELAEKLDEAEKESSAAKKAMDEYSQSVSKAGDSGERLKTIVGKGLKNALKVGTAAVGAAITAIGALTKQSVQLFAEYEQLAGGAEKIFDQMDISKIMTDAANAYKDLGLSASEYLAVINNVGATFASTMGDAAGYEAAKRGLQAISDYASGTGKSVDELSDKFMMITRSTSSYQSIADQFSGILPATSADFLKQAQAAGLLSKKYEKLTDVPVAQYQQAVTAMLERGVDALGLTGNTAAEAEKTLSGSLGMMSAAWKNLVTGMADDNANLEQLMGNLVTSVIAVSRNLVPRIRTVLVSIGQLIKELAPIIAAELPGLVGELLPQLLSAANSLLMSLIAALPGLFTSLQGVIPMAVEAILTALPMVTVAAIQIIVALINGITGNAPLLISSAISAVEQFVLALLGNLPALVEAGLQLLVALANGIVSAIPQLTAMLPLIIESTVSTLLSLLPLILAAGTDILVGLIDGIVTAIPELIAMLPLIIETIFGVLIDNIDLVISAGFQLLVGLISGIWDAVPRLISMLPEIIASIVRTFTSYLPKLSQLGVQFIDSLTRGVGSATVKLVTKALEIGQKMIDVFKELPSKIVSVGKNLVQGLWSGLSSSVTWIKNKIKGWVGDVLSFIKNLFGIHSPSKKTAYFGRMLSEGLAKGITQMDSAVFGAINALNRGIDRRLVSGIIAPALSVPVSATITNPKIPMLATGAVIPPNARFAAVLGDQRHGNNLEAPESLIRQIVREESGNGNTYNVKAVARGRTIFDIVLEEGKKRQQQTGKNPFVFA